jgi:regulator of replication initiation timing
VGRLDVALSALKTELTAAQQDLTQQISTTNERLRDLIWVLAQKANPGDPSGHPGKEIEHLGQLLAGRERAEGASAQHMADLETTVTDLKAEIALLRSQEAWLVTANQDLSERLVTLRAESKTTVKTLGEAEVEIERLKNSLAQQERNAQILRDELETVHHAQENSPETLKHLASEVTSLRYDNARLRVALEETEARAAARARRQEILLESLLSNGRTCRIGELLVSAGVITQRELDDALKTQESTPSRLLGSILMDEGHAGEEEITQAVACQCELPFISLNGTAVMPEAARLVDAATCRRHQCIPVRAAPNRLFVAMANPRNRATVPAIEQETRRRVIPLVATPSDITSAIQSVYGPH